MDIMSVCHGGINSAVFFDVTWYSLVRPTDVSAHDTVQFDKSRKVAFYIYHNAKRRATQAFIVAKYVSLTVRRRTTHTLCRRVLGSIPERSIIRVGQLWPFFSETLGYFLNAFASIGKSLLGNLHLGLSHISPGNNFGDWRFIKSSRRFWAGGSCGTESSL